MALTRDDVVKLCALARLAMDEREMEERRNDLDRILGYVDRLQKVDVSGVPEAERIGQTKSEETFVVWREDEAIPCDAETRDRILSNFPDALGDALRVPAVFEHPKG